MLYGRFGHTATLLSDGTVLVAGGADQNTAEKYTGSSWKPAGNLITNRSKHTATVLRSGKVLVTGGGMGDGALQSAELYDPGTGEYGTWSTTGAMRQARTEHTATLLLSGKVLVAGGRSGSASGIPSVEEYDPETGTWNSSSILNAGRVMHTATLLPTGKLLVTGGFGTSSFLDSAEVYDVEPGGWRNEVALDRPRSSHTVTLLPTGKVLVAGGLNGDSPLESASLYDPARGAWSPAASLGTARARHTTTLLPNGKLLAAGGTQDGRSPLNSAELYDPKLDSWSPTAPLGTPRFGHTATLLSNGKLLVAGGTRDGRTPLNSVELYDPVSKSWHPIKPLLTARSGQTATLLPGGHVLIAGGQDGTSSLDSAELYDPVNPDNPWTFIMPLGTPRSGHTATLLPSGLVLVVGGTPDGSTPLNSAELYDPGNSDTPWTSIMPLGTSRSGHTATLLPSGQVLVAGGTNGIRDLSSAEVYDPALGVWNGAPSLTTARSSHTATLLPSGRVLIAGGLNGNGSLASAQVYSGMGTREEQVSRPVIDTLDPSKPQVALELTGSLLRSRPEAGGGNAHSSASTFPWVSLMAVEGGALARISQWVSSSDTSLTFIVPDVPTGYYILSVMTHGSASGQLVLVDGTPPEKPVMTVTNARGKWVNTRKPILTGTAEPESTVKVLLDETVARTAEADPNGSWSLELESELLEDSYVAEAIARDAAGNESSRSDALSFTIDATPPGQPQVTAPAPIVNTLRPVIRGRAEPGSTVKVVLAGVEKVIAMEKEQSEWEFTPEEDLEPDRHHVIARAEDEAGNPSDPTEHSFVIPMSHYGWNCSSGPAFPVSGLWLLVLWWFGRRGGRPLARPLR
jgi:hypothetical protein